MWIDDQLLSELHQDTDYSSSAVPASIYFSQTPLPKLDLRSIRSNSIAEVAGMPMLTLRMESDEAVQEADCIGDSACVSETQALPKKSPSVCAEFFKSFEEIMDWVELEDSLEGTQEFVRKVCSLHFEDPHVLPLLADFEALWNGQHQKPAVSIKRTIKSASKLIGVYASRGDVSATRMMFRALDIITFTFNCSSDSQLQTIHPMVINTDQIERSGFSLFNSEESTEIPDDLLEQAKLFEFEIKTGSSEQYFKPGIFHGTVTNVFSIPGTKANAAFLFERNRRRFYLIPKDLHSSMTWCLKKRSPRGSLFIRKDTSFFYKTELSESAMDMAAEESDEEVLKYAAEPVEFEDDIMSE